MRGLWLCLLGMALSGCVQPPAPQKATDAALEHIFSRMVVSADPQASAAGIEMLRQGGSAVDAAIATQAVLGLVEPQASGLLGGSVLLAFDPATSTIESYDGMVTAPAAATKAVALSPSGEMLDPREVAFSARAIGIPGVLPALWEAHKAHGKLPWARLFEPAIKLAEDGAAMPKPLHDLLTEPDAGSALKRVTAPYLTAGGKVIATGALFRNPQYAAVLSRVAHLGPDGLYAGDGMGDVMQALGTKPHPSLITAADLHAAKPRIEHALCAPWQGLQICTAPAPSMGGLVMLQILGVMADKPDVSNDPANPAFVHNFLEASRLAEADRRRYLADPSFVDVPVQGLIDTKYLAERASLISPTRSIAQPRPGDMDEADAFLSDPHAPQSATSTIAAVDGTGLVIAMTTTINLHFGARISADGMIFNNGLLNFAPPPPTTMQSELGGHYANEMAPGKRPVSPIAPLIVLDATGKPLLAGGGAGGAPIPDTMAMALISVLQRHDTVEQALSAGHFHAADPDHIALETGTSASGLQPALEAVGHRVVIEPIDTGNALMLHTADGWLGASDPRRDGGPAGGLH